MLYRTRDGRVPSTATGIMAVEGRHVTALQVTYGGTMGGHRFHRVVDGDGYGVDIAGLARQSGGHEATRGHEGSSTQDCRRAGRHTPA